MSGWGVTFHDRLNRSSQVMVAADDCVGAIQAALREVKFDPDYPPVRVEAELIYGVEMQSVMVITGPSGRETWCIEHGIAGCQRCPPPTPENTVRT